jgi:hypothetical protein
MTPVGVNELHPALKFSTDIFRKVGVDDGGLVHKTIPIIGNGSAVPEVRFKWALQLVRDYSRGHWDLANDIPGLKVSNK